MPPPSTLPIQFRSLEIPTDGTLEERGIDQEKRTINLSFSSTHAIKREYGWEVLDHSPGAMMTERLRESGPLLLDHDWSRQIGRVTKNWISEGRGYATVKFSQSEKAKEIFQDCLDGIRSSVSVGYIVHELVADRGKGEPDFWRVSSWEPVEISLVAVPADYTVGVDRSGQKDFAVRILEPNPPIMAKQVAAEPANTDAETPATPEKPNYEIVRQQTREEETKRIKAIYATGQRFQAAEEAEIFVRDGKSLEEFEHMILVDKLKARPLSQVPATVADQMSQKERQSYSIVKVIRELSNIDLGCRLSGLEKEVSEAIEREMQSLPQESRRSRTGGISAYIPTDLRMPTPGRGFGRMGRRDMNVTITANAGDSFVAEEFIPSLIEYLRNALVVQSAGATVLSGLQGMVVIPKVAGVTQAAWYSETAPIIPSDLLTTQIALQPRRLGASTIYSRQLVIQSSLDIEALIRSDLANTMAQMLDYTTLFGDPVANPSSPRGVFLSTAGDLPADPIDPTDVVQVVTFGTGTLYEDYISFVVALDNMNISANRPAYIGNPSSWAAAISTPKFPNTGMPIMEGSTILGYPFYRTNQIPNAGQWANRVAFGDWSQLLIGQWQGISLIVDPYTLASNSQIKIVVHQFADLALRYRRAFAVSANAGALLRAEAGIGGPKKIGEGDRGINIGEATPGERVTEPRREPDKGRGR